MSKLKFYDNGSIASAGNVATGYSSNLLLGDRNIAAKYKATYHGADLSHLMYIEDDVYYFSAELFISNLPESAPSADSVILQHTPEHFYEKVYDLTKPYETSTFISTGSNPTKDGITYCGFKLAEGPALTNASGYFEWLTVEDKTQGAIVNGIDNASVGSNLVMGWDNRVNGTYNTIMTQHATVDGDYNYIKTARQYALLRGRFDFKGSFNILVNASTFIGFNGSYNYMHGDQNMTYGNYNLVFGRDINCGRSDASSQYDTTIGKQIRNYGNYSVVLGSTGSRTTGTTGSTMGKLATYNTNLGDYSYIIGTDNFNGLRGVRINTLQYTGGSETFSVTLKDKATFQSNVIYIFYYAAWVGVYGKYKTSSTSNGVTTYTFTRVDSTGTTATSISTLNYDFSSDTSPIYWHCVFPSSAPHVWSSGEGVLLPMNNAASSTTLATTPVNNLPLGGQVYGLGSITIGHNNVNIGSRSILIGNDLGGNTVAGDKIIRIGNGDGVNYASTFINYTSPYLPSDDNDGNVVNAFNSRKVILENKFTDSKSNSTLSMTYSGISCTSPSYSFGTNTGIPTGKARFFLNVPLYLSSGQHYGPSLPVGSDTQTVMSGRIFFLV